jgi:hypothetical protein
VFSWHGKPRNILLPEKNFVVHWDKALYTPQNWDYPRKTGKNLIQIHVVSGTEILIN